MSADGFVRLTVTLDDERSRDALAARLGPSAEAPGAPVPPTSARTPSSGDSLPITPRCRDAPDTPVSITAFDPDDADPEPGLVEIEGPVPTLYHHVRPTWTLSVRVPIASVEDLARDPHVTDISESRDLPIP